MKLKTINNKFKKISIFVILIIWVFLTLLSSKGVLAADGVFEIGFPIPFYRSFNGKGNREALDLGFDPIDFVFDVFCLIITFFIFFLTFSSKAKN